MEHYGCQAHLGIITCCALNTTQCYVRSAETVHLLIKIISLYQSFVKHARYTLFVYIIMTVTQPTYGQTDYHICKLTVCRACYMVQQTSTDYTGTH